MGLQTVLIVGVLALATLLEGAGALKQKQTHPASVHQRVSR